MQSISISSSCNRSAIAIATSTNNNNNNNNTKVSSSYYRLQQQQQQKGEETNNKGNNKGNSNNNSSSDDDFLLLNPKATTTTTTTANKKNIMVEQQQQQAEKESSSSSSSSSFESFPPSKKQRGSTSSEEGNNRSRRIFSIDDVDVLDLVCHATWIFDITNKKFLFGNTAALEFWKADSLDDFINRSFDDMSETTMKKNLDILERLKRDEKWAESWTFYPNNGKPVSVSMKVSPIYIKLSDDDEGHLCQFSEAIPAAQTEEEKVSPDFLRAASMLRYLPMAVSQFNSHTGQLMHQNPEACSVFGWPKTSTISNCNHACNGSSTSTINNNNIDVTTATTTTTTTTTCGDNDNDHHDHHHDDDGPVSMDADDDDLSSSNGGCCTCKEEEENEGFSGDDNDKASSTTKSTETATTTATSSSSSSSATLEHHLQQQQPQGMMDTAAAAPTLTTMMRRSTSTSSLFSLCSNTMLDEENNCCCCSNNRVHDQHDDEDRSSSQEDAAAANVVVVDDEGVDPSSSSSMNHFLSRFVDKKLALKLLKKIKSGQDVSVEALVHTKSGTEWNAIHARLAMDAVSEDPVILYTARDITEIINAKKEMQLNLERAEFFAIMAHEIRTPLFQVTGFIDLLDETDLNKDQRDFIKLLRAAASSLMTVINDVLDYSKLEAGKMKLDIVPFEPKAVVDGSMAAIAPSAEDKGITLKTNFARVGVPVKLMGDPNRLRQVLLNLLQNAIKFTHTGSIEASVDLVSTCISSNSSGCDDVDDCSQKNQQQSQVMLRFSIKDTGIGISKEHVGNIFRKYTQAAASIATSYGGTGLGLSICKSLVECMGGNIGVDSVWGQGSVFWFQIPFDRIPESSAESPSSHYGDDEKAAGMGTTGSCKKQKTRQLNVLVAEDNGVSRKMISKMLKSLGHDTTLVENGEEAVKEVRLRDGNFDLILMDMQMPVMDGIDATKHIRSMGYTAVPIVGLTASVRRGDFQNLGLDDWIGKPVRLKELQKRLSSYFDDPVDDTETSAPVGGGGDDQSSTSATQPNPGVSTVGLDSLSISLSMRQRESLLEAPPPENTKVTSKLFAENKMRNNMSIDILPTIALPKL